MADVTLTDQNFDAEVLKSTVPVLVDFWAAWCGPCQMQGPIIEDVAKTLGAKAKIGKLNVDENSKTAGTYGIMSIPTILIFKGGAVVKQMIGLQNKDMILGELNKLI